MLGFVSFVAYTAFIRVAVKYQSQIHPFINNAKSDKTFRHPKTPNLLSSSCTDVTARLATCLTPCFSMWMLRSTPKRNISSRVASQQL